MGAALPSHRAAASYERTYTDIDATQGFSGEPIAGYVEWFLQYIAEFKDWRRFLSFLVQLRADPRTVEYLLFDKTGAVTGGHFVTGARFEEIT